MLPQEPVGPLHLEQVCLNRKWKCSLGFCACTVLQTWLFYTQQQFYLSNKTKNGLLYSPLCPTSSSYHLPTSYPTFTFFSHFTRYVLSSYASFLSCIFWHTFLYSNSIFNLRSFLPPLSLYLFMFFNSKYAPSVHYVAVFPPSAITFVLPLISFLPSCLPLSLFLRLFTKSPSPPNCYGPLYSWYVSTLWWYIGCWGGGACWCPGPQGCGRQCHLPSGQYTSSALL